MAGGMLGIGLPQIQVMGPGNRSLIIGTAVGRQHTTGDEVDVRTILRDTGRTCTDHTLHVRTAGRTRRKLTQVRTLVERPLGRDRPGRNVTHIHVVGGIRITVDQLLGRRHKRPRTIRRKPRGVRPSLCVAQHRRDRPHPVCTETPTSQSSSYPPPAPAAENSRSCSRPRRKITRPSSEMPFGHGRPSRKWCSGVIDPDRPQQPDHHDGLIQFAPAAPGPRSPPSTTCDRSRVVRKVRRIGGAGVGGDQ